MSATCSICKSRFKKEVEHQKVCKKDSCQKERKRRNSRDWYKSHKEQKKEANRKYAAL